jgi:hypothetical protein
MVLGLNEECESEQSDRCAAGTQPQVGTTAAKPNGERAQGYSGHDREAEEKSCAHTIVDTENYQNG